MIKYLLIIAKITSLISISILTLFFLNGSIQFYALQEATVLLMLFFPVGVVLGMIIGWIKPLWGGMIGCASFVLFYLIHYFKVQFLPEGFAFTILAFPNFLFLIEGFLQRNLNKE